MSKCSIQIMRKRGSLPPVDLVCSEPCICKVYSILKAASTPPRPTHAKPGKPCASASRACRGRDAEPRSTAKPDRIRPNFACRRIRYGRPGSSCNALHLLQNPVLLCHSPVLLSKYSLSKGPISHRPHSPRNRGNTWWSSQCPTLLSLYQNPTWHFSSARPASNQ
ncbi:hypothetical protein BDW02DRAFT_269325 [Decorospora gaudefroyi]|uniref:Uncharacterized protein n=1 Tax=Decorospora gaudefroyi TaxID=184978 RepID=A0A6A5KI14_9PLEO|nr:hypothetical protein BDW02DRAFT_269325 [Decorospora gaudefroyi]